MSCPSEVRPVADDLAVDPRPARLGPPVLLEHQHASAAGDDEAVAVLVEGAGGDRRAVIVAGRHGTHGVEQHGQRPVELLAAAGEHHVLLAVGDHLVGVADAMVRRRAGRRDRIARALDLEPGAERRRGGRGHRLRHGERADALRPLLARDVGGFNDRFGGRTAGAHQDAGARVRNVPRHQVGVADRLLHGEMRPGGAAAMEAHRADGRRRPPRRKMARRRPANGSRAWRNLRLW